MPLIFIGIVCASVVVALIVRAAVRRRARGKCRTLVAVARAVLEDGFGSEIGGRTALSRLTEAAALRGKHGFTTADLGLTDEAEFDELFTRALAAANPEPTRVLNDVGARPEVPDEQRLVTREMPVAAPADPDDEPTEPHFVVPPEIAALTANNDVADVIGDDEPTIPGFRIPQTLLDASDDTAEDAGVDTLPSGVLSSN